MVYLLQFLLPNTSCLASNKKLQVTLKARKSSLNKPSKPQIPFKCVTDLGIIIHGEALHNNKGVSSPRCHNNP